MSAQNQKKTGRLAITVNPAYCKGCGICVAFCPEQVLAMEGEKSVVVHLDACTECLQCEMRCPDFAITVERFAAAVPEDA
jgi:2-oxoglutarate ferredoxin oxidoreductase subunit delta